MRWCCHFAPRLGYSRGDLWHCLIACVCLNMRAGKEVCVGKFACDNAYVVFVLFSCVTKRTFLRAACPHRTNAGVGLVHYRTLPYGARVAEVPHQPPPPPLVPSLQNTTQPLAHILATLCRSRHLAELRNSFQVVKDTPT